MILKVFSCLCMIRYHRARGNGMLPLASTPTYPILSSLVSGFISTALGILRIHLLLRSLLFLLPLLLFYSLQIYQIQPSLPYRLPVPDLELRVYGGRRFPLPFFCYEGWYLDALGATWHRIWAVHITHTYILLSVPIEDLRFSYDKRVSRANNFLPPLLSILLMGQSYLGDLLVCKAWRSLLNIKELVAEDTLSLDSFLGVDRHHLLYQI